MRATRQQYTEAEAKAVINRLSRAIGHLESIKNMISDGRDCSEILIQLSAVKSAVNNAGVVLLQSHMRRCVVEAVQEGDTQLVDDLSRALGTYIK
ncbi:MAG: metal-sensing transcriptional repressor [Oscillospiraceae bacterium]|nr:metal-sensing transcriptional repressor [Oscillospiraceae bacterium]